MSITRLLIPILLAACGGGAPPQVERPTDTGSTTTPVVTTLPQPPENLAAWLASEGSEAVDSSFLTALDDVENVVCVATDASCLAQTCTHPAGCLALADLHTTSTPDSVLGGPPLRIQTVLTQVVAEGEAAQAAPVLYANHGGSELSDPDFELILLSALDGFVVLASHYRGSGGSEGVVEGCLGEVDDVLSLVALGQTGAPNQTHLMMGGSHGGCVTLGVLHRGPDLAAAVAIFPGADAARRYPYHKAQIQPGSQLTVAAQTCAQAQFDLDFLTSMVVDGEAALGGELPDWQTADYRCDDPAFAPRSTAWNGLEWEEEQICGRSPLSTATTLNGAFTGDLLIVHGERDITIPFSESCDYAEQAGGFQAWRIDDSGQWAAGGCSALPATGAEPPGNWAGDRHLLLVEPLGHGDARADLFDACDPTPFVVPDVNGLILGFLESRR